MICIFSGFDNHHSLTSDLLPPPPAAAVDSILEADEPDSDEDDTPRPPASRVEAGLRHLPVRGALPLAAGDLEASLLFSGSSRSRGSTAAASTPGWHCGALEPARSARERSSRGCELGGVPPRGGEWPEPAVDAARRTGHGGDTLASTCAQQRERGRERSILAGSSGRCEAREPSIVN